MNPLKFINKLVREKNTLALSANISVAAFRFVSFLLLVRLFEKEIFGEWILYITAAGLIEMIRFGITKIAIIRFLSGAKDEERKVLIGSNWIISLIITTIITILLIVILNFFPDTIKSSGYYYFFAWYPLLGFFNLPYNNAITILQAKQRFGSILFLNTFLNGFFLVFVILNYFVFQFGIFETILAYLSCNLLTSIISMIKGWDGHKYIRHTSRKIIKKILNFGKFSLGTMIGSNLLKNADTIIIGLSPLGTEAVALYSIPLKLTEILEIPLRSFLATAFPKMSKASVQNNVRELKNVFYTYSGAITLLFVPIIIICIIFAPLFIQIIGGEKYLETIQPVIIFQIFAVYGLFLPIDRFTGVALDSINKPHLNFYKVLIMALLNIIGDLIAIYIFNSLILVAVVTIIFTIVGLFVGYHYLNLEISMNFREIFIKGFNFYKSGLKAIKNK